MNAAILKTFNSPYHVLSLKSSRYKGIMRYFAALLIIIPLVFLAFHSFSVFLLSEVLTFMLFPIFLWSYLHTDEITDIKLDTLKVCVMSMMYFSYLMGLTWIMLKIFNPVFKKEYMLIKLGYILLLVILTVSITAIFFYNRYTEKRLIEHREKIKHRKT